MFFAVANLLNLEVDLLFFDTTSTFFEREGEEEGADGFRRFGHSKDHRPTCRRSSSAWRSPARGSRCACGAGRATPTTSTCWQVKDDMRGWRLGRVITVVDRGFSSDDNLAYLSRAGGH